MKNQTNNNMNIYTHFNTIDGIGYRWRTLLQFGSSWDIIGSVVMMNPGSAKYKYGKDVWITDSQILSHLNYFEYPGYHEENWFEFGSDQTLECVADLFAQYKNVTNRNELSGVIQVFNLFYLRDPNLNRAIKTNHDILAFKQINDLLFEQDIKNLRHPVYLGFGSLAHSPEFREKAVRFFNEAIEKHNAQYLYKEFDSNGFMHPRALMRLRKNKPDGIIKRHQFCLNTTDSLVIEKAISKMQQPCLFTQEPINQVEVVEKVRKKLQEMGIVHIQNYQESFPMGLELMATITSKGKGYVAIRHVNFNPNLKYGQFEYPHTDDYVMILKNHGYEPDKSWLGVKRFKEYYSSSDEVVERIVNEFIELSKEVREIEKK